MSKAQAIKEVQEGKRSGYTETATDEVVKYRKRPIFRMETLSKAYRLDLGMWEEKVRILHFVRYQYKVQKGGVLIGRLERQRLPNPVYFKPVKLAPLPITWAEVQGKYKGNKWLVPQNFKIVP